MIKKSILLVLFILSFSTFIFAQNETIGAILQELDEFVIRYAVDDLIEYIPRGGTVSISEVQVPYNETSVRRFVERLVERELTHKRVMLLSKEDNDLETEIPDSDTTPTADMLLKAILDGGDGVPLSLTLELTDVSSGRKHTTMRGGRSIPTSNPFLETHLQLETEVSTTTIPSIESIIHNAVEQVSQSLGVNQKIFVIDFVHPNPERRLFFTREIERSLTTLGYSVLARTDRVERFAGELAGQNGTITRAQGITLGRYADADVIVYGEIEGTTTQQSMRLQIIRIPSGEILGDNSINLPEQ